jgi:aspartyl/glutamyl-tRNA(Asn/Gln) amidotransferase C subunit
MEKCQIPAIIEPMDANGIKNLAHLSRLSLTAEEEAAYGKDFEGILGYISQLDEVAGRITESTISVVQNPELRADVARESVSADAIIGQFPEKSNRHLKVPQVLQYED